MEQITCSFLGLGLIGGSIARSLKAHRNDIFIRVYDIDHATVSLALEEGIADEILPALNAETFPVLADCDYLFLCATVARNNHNLLLLKPWLKETCLITDVGSVKSEIHQQIHTLGLSAQFIGGHPMAGSERVGFQNSKTSLLENAFYILTPTAEVDPGKVEAYADLVKSMGAIPLILDYDKHDYVTAAVSHLPHVIASSLVNLVEQSDSENEIMKMIAAGGFKDITRIASSSPVMWQQICLTNAFNLSQLLERYILSLQQIKDDIDNHHADELYTFFDSARQYRDSFIEASSGPIKKVYTIHVEIPDEAGSLAAAATLLALNQISIKNIGITHNREAEDGVLRIEFYEEEAIDKADKLLTGRGYTTFRKR